MKQFVVFGIDYNNAETWHRVVQAENVCEACMLAVNSIMSDPDWIPVELEETHVVEVVNGEMVCHEIEN